MPSKPRVFINNITAKNPADLRCKRQKNSKTTFATVHLHQQKPTSTGLAQHQSATISSHTITAIFPSVSVRLV